MHKHHCGRGARRFGAMPWLMAIGPRGFGRGFGGFGGDGWDGEGWGDARRRRHGPRGPRVFAPGELRLVLLALIAETPRHGYELIKEIEQLADGAYSPSPGVVYPTLSLLVDEGLANEAAGEGARKAYAVTDSGRAELDQRAAELEALLARLKALADDRRDHAAPPVRRAVGNLFAALRHRALAGGLSDEAAHRVAEILDEAARRIERL